MKYFCLFPGVVFEQHTDEIQNAFKFAMVQQSSPNRSRLDFQLYVDVINTADAFKLSRLSKCILYQPCSFWFTILRFLWSLFFFVEIYQFIFETSMNYFDSGEIYLCVLIRFVRILLWPQRRSTWWNSKCLWVING